MTQSKCRDVRRTFLLSGSSSERPHTVSRIAVHTTYLQMILSSRPRNHVLPPSISVTSLSLQFYNPKPRMNCRLGASLGPWGMCVASEAAKGHAFRMVQGLSWSQLLACVGGLVFVSSAPWPSAASEAFLHHPIVFECPYISDEKPHLIGCTVQNLLSCRDFRLQMFAAIVAVVRASLGPEPRITAAVCC